MNNRSIELEDTLKLALEGLVNTEALLFSMGLSRLNVYSDIEKAITAIKEALAQQSNEQVEPVAWDGGCVLGHCGSPAGCEASNCCRADYTTPYVATPRPQRTWVGLTDEDVAKISEQGWQQWLNYQQVAQIVEAKLKEKNT